MADEPWGPLTRVVRHEIGPGPFNFEPSEVTPGRRAPLATYAFDGVRAVGSEFDLSEVALTIQHGQFDDCRFVQRRRPAGDGTWGQGSLARRPTTYRDCVFEGVRFRVRAGFTVGAARFERCSFLRCDFGEHFSFCADYIGCTFAGAIKKAVFYGRAPDGHSCDGKSNVITGNDFTAATFGDVGLRGGVPIEDQRWPRGIDPDSLVDDISP